jgi:alkylhydroperoxidase/carboxymuconolactone decarboxylase family protein YurZ
MIRLLDEKVVRILQDEFRALEKWPFFYCPLISAAIAAGDHHSLKTLFPMAIQDKVSSQTIREIILQSHLFLGYPAMIEAARIFAPFHSVKSNAAKTPAAYTSAEVTRWHREGSGKIRRLYGSQFGQLVSYINSFSPQILTWMVNDGYGRVLSRPGATFRLRELSTVATLTVTGYENQLLAHIRGTVNIGVKPSLIAQTIEHCRLFCAAAKIKQARKILGQVTAA